MMLVSPGYDGSAGSSALVAAARWIESALLGSIATIVAVVAIAVVGLMMLSGRIDIRRGMTTVLGCFLLFGAPMIAAGLRAASDGNAPQPTPYVEPPAATVRPPVAPMPAPTPVPYDPYSGASVPSGN